MARIWYFKSIQLPVKLLKNNLYSVGHTSLCSQIEVMLKKVESSWKQLRIYHLFQDFPIGESVPPSALIAHHARSGSSTQWIAIYLRTLSLLNLPPVITLLVGRIVLVMKTCHSLPSENVSATSNPNPCGSPAVMSFPTKTIWLRPLTQQQWSSQEEVTEVCSFLFQILCYSVENFGP